MGPLRCRGPSARPRETLGSRRCRLRGPHTQGGRGAGPQAGRAGGKQEETLSFPREGSAPGNPQKSRGAQRGGDTSCLALTLQAGGTRSPERTVRKPGRSAWEADVGAEAVRAEAVRARAVGAGERHALVPLPRPQPAAFWTMFGDFKAPFHQSSGSLSFPSAQQPQSRPSRSVETRRKPLQDSRVASQTRTPPDWSTQPFPWLTAGPP